MKKLSKNEKLLRGTFQASREKELMTIEPLTEIPVPMFPLDDIATGYYTQCAEILTRNKTLTESDIPGLTRAAKWFGIFNQALKDIEIYGCYQKTQSGYTAKNAHFQVLTEAEKVLTAWERSQGLNLVSRSKLPPPPPPVEYDPFDDV